MARIAKSLWVALVPVFVGYTVADGSTTVAMGLSGRDFTLIDPTKLPDREVKTFDSTLNETFPQSGNHDVVSICVIAYVCSMYVHTLADQDLTLLRSLFPSQVSRIRSRRHTSHFAKSLRVVYVDGYDNYR